MVNTKEELAIQMKETNDKIQNAFIDKLLESVEWFYEKANKKTYIPTEHEREQFNRIRQILNNMNNWF